MPREKRMSRRLVERLTGPPAAPANSHGKRCHGYPIEVQSEETLRQNAASRREPAEPIATKQAVE